MPESPVIVEFLGVVRQKAGREQAEFSAERLQDLWRQVPEQFPQLEGYCLEGGKLKHGFLASIDGRRFTRSLDETLSPGDRVLLLSADAGG